MERHKAIAAGLLLSIWGGVSTTLRADEGFYSPQGIPYEQIHETYPSANLTPDKVHRLTQATVKITAPHRPGQGGTGVFISPDGLVLTNHHVAEHCLEDQRLARARPNPKAPFGQHFFYAATREQEIPCYVYHLQQDNRTFKDVRLVYLPSAEIAKLGAHLLKDIAMHLQPLATYQADFAFLRAYDETSEQPVDTAELYLPPNTQPSFQDGDFVMTVSFPNNTQRHQSYFYLQHLDSVVLPLEILYFSTVENVLLDRIRRLESQSNPDKVTLRALIELHDGRFTQRLYQGLQRVLIMTLGLVERQKSQDAMLAAAITNTPELTPRYGHLFSDLQETYGELQKTYPSSYWLQKLLDTSLLNTPYRLIRHRLPHTSPVPPGISRADLNPRGPFRAEVDEAIHFLSGAITIHRDNRFDIPWIAELTRSISRADTLTPHDLASRVIYRIVQTSLFYQNPAYRYELLTTEHRALERDPDPLIHTLLTLHQALETAKQRTQALKQSLKALHTLYEEALQSVFSSTPAYKNADGSLRFSYGHIQRLDTIIPEYPFSLSAFSSFMTLKDQRVDNKTLLNRFKPNEARYLWRAKHVFEDLPINVLSTLDIAHGSSGSALVNADLQVIGTNFARNWAPKIHDAIYHGAHRAISVSLSFALAYLAAEVAGAFTDEPPERPAPPNRLVQELQAAENHVSKTTR